MQCRQGFDSRNGTRPAEHVKLGYHWEWGRVAAAPPPFPEPAAHQILLFPFTGKEGRKGKKKGGRDKRKGIGDEEGSPSLVWSTTSVYITS